MARRSVGDEDSVFRVVVSYKKQTKNQNYWALTEAERINTNEDPYFVSEDEMTKVFYGPYGTKGQAKGQATHHKKLARWRDLYVETHIEEATIQWNRVE